MKRLKKIALGILVLLFAVALPILLFPRETQAYSESSDAWKKAMATAIRKCYDEGAMQSPLSLDEYDAYHSALYGGEIPVQVPNLNGNSNTMKCYELFNKYVKWTTGDPGAEAAFLTDKLGYTKESSGDQSGECFYFQFSYTFDDKTVEDNVPTDYICAEKINDDGTIGVDKMTIRPTNNEHGGSSFNVEWENKKGKISIDCHVQLPGGGAGSVSFTKGSTKWSEFKNNIQQTMINNKTCLHDRHGVLLGGYDMYLDRNFIGTETYGDVKAKFEIKDKSAAAAKATNYMLGQAYSSNPAFSKTDTFSMYQAYVTEYYNADIVCSDSMTDNDKTALKTLGYVDIAVYNGSKIDPNCFAKATKNSTAQSSGAEGTFGDYRTFEQICAWMNSNASGIDTSKLDGGASTKTPDEIGKPDNSGNSKKTDDGSGDATAEADDEEKCYANAKSLGWVICPIVYGLRDMTDKFFTIVEPWLQTNDSIVGELGNSSSGLYSAWVLFRNLANVVFVILFLFVVFSQLTGYGIDNYGIKKMLPKLILTAIIVNLSFIICAVAVDISNIAGSAIKGLFESIAVDSTSLGGDSAHAVGVIVQKVVGAIALIGMSGGAVAIGVALEGWAIIIPILLFLLTVAIAGFFAIVVLGVRQALIVILIVVSPVAFVCMVLPNTEGIYKKWWNAAKNILMVYPIVGGVIGAGYLTASILMSADSGFFMTLVAGILMVAPYFMIPSLTRRALDSVGNIGHMLGTASARTGAAARHGINNTEGVRNFRADQAANARHRRANGRFHRWLDQKTLDAAKNNEGKTGLRARIARGTIASNGRLRAVQRNNANRVDGSRESLMTNANASQRNLERMETGGYAAREAGLEDEAMQRVVSDYEKLISTDKYAYSDEHGAAQTVDFTSEASIGSALRAELLKGDSADQNKIRALQNTLNRKGDKGRNQIYNAMVGAQESAAKGVGSISKESTKTFSGNILNNQGDYKASHRSLYEYAKQTSGGESKDIKSFGAKGIEALTADSFLNTDATQMARYLDAYNKGAGKEAEGGLSDSERTRLEEIAHSIANNENVHSKIRKDDYGAALQAFAGDVNWSDIYNGNGLKVDHSNSSATQAQSTATQTPPTTTQSATTPTTPPSQTAAAQGASVNAATVNADSTISAARAAQSKVEAGASAKNQRITSSERAQVENAIKEAERGGGRETDSGIWLPS